MPISLAHPDITVPAVGTCTTVCGIDLDGVEVSELEPLRLCLLSRLPALGCVEGDAGYALIAALRASTGETPP